MVPGVTLDLWHWRLEGGDARLLSPDEQARAARFVFARDRARYIAGRAGLRVRLGRFLDQPPESLRLSYGPNGKPALDGASFNLSHSGDLAALVVTRADLPLGIDIETIRPIEPGLAQAHFAHDELAGLQNLPPNAREAAFFTLWTRKEAFLKATGQGLMADLASFSVPLEALGTRMIRTSKNDADQWHILDAPPAPGMAGAIVIRAGAQKVRLLRHGEGLPR